MKKRIFALVFAVVTAFSAMSFVGCGSTANSSTAETTSAAAAQAQTNADVNAVAEKLKSGITFKDELAKLNEAKIKTIIGVSNDLYTKATVYVSSSGATAEEIDCFEAKDESSAKTIAEKLEARVKSQSDRFTDYAPKEMTKLKSANVITNGKCVYLCLSDDDAKSKEIIG